MKDTIYREDAINVLLRMNGIKIDKALAIGEIRSISSADRPQGEWIEIGTFSHSYKCSVCGRTLFNTTVGKNHVAKYYPYCHCGARMKGVDDETTAKGMSEL